MNVSTAAVRRSGLAVLASLALVLVSGQVLAQSCNGNPNARITPDNQTVPETTGGSPTVVQLDGSNSTPTGQPLTYLWARVSGPAITLSNPNVARPTFAAPDVGPAGAVVVMRLTVTCGSRNDQRTTNINITNVVSNLPPVAIGSASPGTATEGQTVTLNGTSSYDPDGSPLTYQWQQIAGSPTVTLTPSNPAGSIVTFTAPNTPADTVLRFRLTVSDGSLLGTDERIVNISWTNDAPVAHLVCPGGLITVDEGDPVLLDGSGSSDPDGSIASYQWSQYSGLPTLGIAGETGSSLAFTAPHLGYNQLGGLVLRLAVTDNSGGEHSADCGVFIRDVTAPRIGVPADHDVEADAFGGATVTYDATAQDAVEDELPRPIACVPPSGSFFPMGPTTVQCDAEDSVEPTPNASSASFQVTVVDTTKPVFVLHGDLEEEAASPDGNVVDYDLPVVNDIADPNPVVACEPPPGSLFPLGKTTVICGAVDASGNEAQAIDFKVTISDTTAPEISGDTGDQTLEATSPAGAVATFALTATDIADPDVDVSCSANSGDTFSLGATLVECTATDDSGNIGEASFTITVEDTTDPVISGAADQTLEATSSAGAAAIFSLTASDIADPSVDALCSANSGDTFPLGDTVVNCSATDASGNTGEASFTITVEDTTAPVISGAADQTLEATSPAGAVATFALSASDIADPSVDVLCSANSGDTFPLGATLVECTATDDSGNVGEASFTITVEDTTDPVISGAGDQTIEATSPAGAVGTFALSASDIADPSVDVLCSANSGDTFPLGATLVECTATDDSGNVGEASFTITVRDTTGPVIAPHADEHATAASGSAAIVHYTKPTASDLVDGTVDVTCTPAPGSSFAVSAAGTTVTCTAEDSRGNASESTFKVYVGYAFTGFFRPIDMPAVVNKVKAGSAVPVKFSLGGNQGMDILAAGFPRSLAMQCQGGVSDAVEETLTAGGSSLSYDATSNQYVYVWKTEKNWAGTCRQLQVKLADGSTIKFANFNFTK